MNNELTTPAHLSAQVSLLDMRRDPVSFPRVGAMKYDDAVVMMGKIVARAMMYRGQNAEPTNVQFIATSLMDELIEDAEGIGTRCISFAEINRIVKRDVLKDDMFVSVATIYQVIAKYIKGEGHQLQKQLQAEKPKPKANDPMLAYLQAMSEVMANNSKI